MTTKLNISVSVSDAARLEQLKGLVYSMDDRAMIVEHNVVYSCENGGDYTADDVKKEIRAWMANTSPFRWMEPRQQDQAVETVYPILLEQLTWQCPQTLLLEWDDDDLANVLEKFQAEHGKIVFSKDKVIEYLGERGYDKDDLADDRNFFWEIVLQFFDYEEVTDVFTWRC